MHPKGDNATNGLPESDTFAHTINANSSSVSGMGVGGGNNRSREKFITISFIISSPDTITTIKLGKMWWARHAIRYGRDEKSIQSFGRKPLKERKPTGRR
jgi:hypothetical protein